MAAQYKDWIVVFDLDGEEKALRFKSSKRYPFDPKHDVDDFGLMDEISDAFGEAMYEMMQDHYPAELA